MKTQSKKINAVIAAIFISLIVTACGIAHAQDYSYGMATFYDNPPYCKVNCILDGDTLLNKQFPDSAWTSMIPLINQHKPESARADEVNPMYNVKGYLRLLQIFPDEIFFQIPTLVRIKLSRILDGSQKYIILCSTVNGCLDWVWIETIAV